MIQTMEPSNHTRRFESRLRCDIMSLLQVAPTDATPEQLVYSLKPKAEAHLFIEEINFITHFRVKVQMQ